MVDMLPFLGILGVQVLMFATLKGVAKISNLNFNNDYENEDEDEGSEIMLKELFGAVMILFGYKSKMENARVVQWALLCTYSFLIYLINMKLLISIIGETYTKMQVSRLAMSYSITTGALLEIGRLRFWERSESFQSNSEETM